MATYTYVPKASQSDLSSLSSQLGNFAFTAITNGTNLDNLKTPGFYGCGSATIAASLVNCPTTSNFAMLYLGKSTSQGTQVIFQPAAIWIRTMSSGNWGSWYKYTGTVVS